MSAKRYDDNNLCHVHDNCKDRLTLENEAYLVPEMLSGSGSGAAYDARAADVWSLGMVLFQLCAGAPLYEPEDAEAMTS